MIRRFGDLERQVAHVLLKIDMRILFRQNIGKLIIHILINPLELPSSFGKMQGKGGVIDLLADDKTRRLPLDVIDSAAQHKLIVKIKRLAAGKIIRRRRLPADIRLPAV